MTDAARPDTHLSLPAKPNIYFIQFSMLSGLVAFADFLFYDNHTGITVPIFLALLCGAGILSLHLKKRLGDWILATSILLIALIPALEVLNPLTFVVALTGSILFIFAIHGMGLNKILNAPLLVVRFLFCAPFRLIVDLCGLNRLRKHVSRNGVKNNPLRNWLLPILMASVFLTLFSFANPLIGGWLAKLDLFWLLEQINIGRALFWSGVAILSWPFLRPAFSRLRTRSARNSRTGKKGPKSTGHARIAGEIVVFRSLVLFNLLFGLQTTLDATYLWTGAELPDGVTYSEYVHNGTYILLCTTLLAIAFILFVTSNTRDYQTSTKIKVMLLLWTGQNVLLVVSTMMRMHLYVEAYALTYLRLSALIWMLIVMVGLALIVVRLKMQYSNEWLVKSNLISLAGILYVTSLLNLPYLIADYNVRVSEQNQQKQLDIAYLSELGEYALPVIDRALKNPEWRTFYYHPRGHKMNLRDRRDTLEYVANWRHSDWRQWSFRHYRLKSYLQSLETRTVTDIPGEL
ncbi:MAG: DUF4153 domain-containing protein [Rhizobiaceae bacterium]